MLAVGSTISTGMARLLNLRWLRLAHLGKEHGRKQQRLCETMLPKYDASELSRASRSFNLS